MGQVKATRTTSAGFRRSTARIARSDLLAAKTLMKEGGVIACEAPRHPYATMHPDTRTGLIETARRLDPMVLRWGR